MSDTEVVQIRVRLDDPALIRRWNETLEKRDISGQKALAGMIRFAVDQEPLVQSMLFGQVPPGDRADMARLLLERIAAEGAKKKPR